MDIIITDKKSVLYNQTYKVLKDHDYAYEVQLKYSSGTVLIWKEECEVVKNDET